VPTLLTETVAKVVADAYVAPTLNRRQLLQTALAESDGTMVAATLPLLR
jgi:hypothetical protein